MEHWCSRPSRCQRSLAFVILLSLALVEPVTTTKWHQQTIIGKVTGSEFKCRSKLECAVLCEQDPGCSGFLFDKTSRTCFMSSQICGDYSISQQQVFYQKSNIMSCPLPPLKDRTTVSVSYRGSSSCASANYSCSVSTDVYVMGTTTITCSGGSWNEQATIVCAPTVCWFNDPVSGPLYRGTMSRTVSGRTCQAWILDYPQDKLIMYKSSDAYLSDNYSMVAASNYCRVFPDNYTGTWCYTTDSPDGYYRWDDCAVPQCPSVPGVRN